MDSHDNIVAVQLSYLLEVVNTHRDESCNRIRNEAEQQAREIIRQAYREGRRRLFQNIQACRQQTQRRIASARARLKTRERLHKQQTDHLFLEMAWEQLHEVLAARWQSANSRRFWVEMILLQASRGLLDKPWQVEHPADWARSEQSRLIDEIYKHTGKQPEMKPAGDIDAGLRIGSGGACVDGSIAGLLADRARIDSDLLSLIGKEPLSP